MTIQATEAAAPAGVSTAARARRIDPAVLRGILLMTAATLFLAISNASAKWLTASYDVSQVLGFRSLISFMAVAAVLLPTQGLGVYRTNIPGAHFARGMSQTISQGLTVLALSLLPIATVTSIGFTAPIWAAIVAVVFIGERFTGLRALSLILGLAGVVIIARPGAGDLNIGMLYALANAVMYGSVTVAVRAMSKTEKPETLLMWQLTTVGLGHGLLLLGGFSWPSMADGAIFLMCGLANAVGQVLWTRSLQAASVTKVSPFYYTLMVWSVLLGMIFLAEIPQTMVIVGCCVILAAGAAILLEKKEAR